MVKNKVIKGDNLKILEKIEEKVNIIYIDPPYFFNEKKAENYLAYNSNFEKSEWLEFLKPRLELGRELLEEDGVIYVSINDDGVYTLKLLMDEIFGIENYIANVIVPRYSSQNKISFFALRHEYVLCYAKNKNILKKAVSFKEVKPGFDKVMEIIEENKEKLNPNEVLSIVKEYYKEHKLKGISLYNKITNDYELYRHMPLDNPKNDEERKYEVLHPKTGKACPCPKRGYRIKKQDLLKEIELGNIIFGKDEKIIPQRKKYLKDVMYEAPKSILDIEIKDGELELKELGLEDSFPFPKSTDLISYLISLTGRKDGIILDFFGGSGTTGHAVMKLNKLDSGIRKFILIEKADYIENLTVERLNRAIEKYSYKEEFLFINSL